MFRVPVRGFALVVAGSAALLATTFVDGADGSLRWGSVVPSVQAQGACARPSMGVEDAILTATENFVISSDIIDVVGYARIRRVEGDWARVVLVPKIETDHATVILKKDRAGAWQVVSGPGTAGFSPEEIPGSPRALYDACP